MLPRVNGFKLSEIDQRILDLNKQGLSNIKISEALKAYGITKSNASVGRHLREMLQDPDNEVQANYKQTNRKPRTEQKWYNIILKLKGEIDAYARRTGFKPSRRTMQYHFQDLHLIEPKDNNAFGDATVKARFGWFDSDNKLLYPKLDMDCFSDDSRKTVGEYDDSEPDAPTDPGSIEDPEEYIKYEISRLKKLPKYYTGVGERGSDGQIGGRWYDQPEYIECWEEKNDLLKGFEIILKGWGIKIRSGKGYGSVNFLNESTWELKELIKNKGLEPEDITILYCGDCDPSGVYIPYYYQKRFAQLGIPGVNFEIVAVTPEQIHKYKLPLMSLEQAEGKKKPNFNTQEYIRLYGNAATHLNAFFTEAHLPAFKKILLQAVANHWDESIYNDMVDEYDVEAEEPPRLTPEELAAARKKIYEEITEAFKSGWENENN
jgi:hypothetical protein